MGAALNLQAEAHSRFKGTTHTDTLTKKQMYVILLVNAVTVGILIFIKQAIFIPMACLTVTMLCLPSHFRDYFARNTQFMLSIINIQLAFLQKYKA